MDPKVRVELEKKVFRALCAHLSEYGWDPIEVAYDDEKGEKVQTVAEAEAAAFAVDEAYVIFQKKRGSEGLGRRHWVLLVMGNSPEELIADNSFGSPAAPSNFAEAMESFDVVTVAYGLKASRGQVP